MDVMYCEQCHAKQPNDWRAGDSCVECGGVVRSDVRCGWCAKLTAPGKFCRQCGFEMTEAEHYGVARMLKQAGVDQLQLRERLLGLPQDRIDHYNSLYHQHLTLALNRIDELRLCQRYLTLKEHVFNLENELIGHLPWNDQQSALMKSGPQGPFENQLERLPEIAAASPLSSTRILACIAWVRCPAIDIAEELESHWFDAVLAAMQAGGVIAAEAFNVVGHWRAQGRLAEAGPLRQVDRAQECLQSMLKLWAAPPNNERAWLACALLSLSRLLQLKLPQAVQEEVMSFVNGALTSAEADLRCSAALLLEDEAVLSESLNSPFPSLVCKAIVLLARQGSGALAGYISRRGEQCEYALWRLSEETSSTLPEALRLSLWGLLEDETVGERLRRYAIQILLTLPQDDRDDLRIATICQRSQLLDGLYSMLVHGDEGAQRCALEAMGEYPLEPQYLEAIAYAASRTPMPLNMIEAWRKFILEAIGAGTLDQYSRTLGQILCGQINLDGHEGFLCLRFILQQSFNAKAPLYANACFQLLRDSAGTRMTYRSPEDGSMTELEMGPEFARHFFGSADLFATLFCELIARAGDMLVWNWALEQLDCSKFDGVQDSIWMHISPSKPMLLERLATQLVARAGHGDYDRRKIARFMFQAPNGVISPLVKGLEKLSVDANNLEVILDGEDCGEYSARMVEKIFEFALTQEDEETDRAIAQFAEYQAYRRGVGSYHVLRTLLTMALTYESATLTRRAAKWARNLSLSLHRYRTSPESEERPCRLSAQWIEDMFHDEGYFLQSLINLFYAPQPSISAAWFVEKVVREDEDNYLSTLLASRPNAAIYFMCAALNLLRFKDLDEDNSHWRNYLSRATQKAFDESYVSEELIWRLSTLPDITSDMHYYIENMLARSLRRLAEQDPQTCANMTQALMEHPAVNSSLLYVLKDFWAEWGQAWMASQPQAAEATPVEEPVEDSNEETVCEEETQEDAPASLIELAACCDGSETWLAEAVERLFAPEDENLPVLLGGMHGQVSELKETVTGSPGLANTLFAQLTRLVTHAGDLPEDEGMTVFYQALILFQQLAEGSPFRYPYMLQLAEFHQARERGQVYEFNLNQMFEALSDDTWRAMSQQYKGTLQ
ncbi:zinc ribbon domain-containing protein [Hahella aquimaris]|uniref:zinc ribbon domain-containing protein n=1 Tax=Hahella sp. HNIBRBA332 TaxID=3015983 RepID=UPI00273C3B11|nr:zinc ribbon domain-containing protein [Hahella sp. HNIBRBA332]WLQ13883.1 zinc ribbon domain-containing protein [Hahella sp. HNIBRBA332]